MIFYVRIEIFTRFVFGISQVSRSKVVAEANKELDSSVWRIRWKSLENIFGKESGTYSGSSWVVTQFKEPKNLNKNLSTVNFVAFFGTKVASKQ